MVYNMYKKERSISLALLSSVRVLESVIYTMQRATVSFDTTGSAQRHIPFLAFGLCLVQLVPNYINLGQQCFSLLGI